MNLKNFTLGMSVMLVFLILSEFTLRLYGYKPGRVQNTMGINEVDTLIQLKGITANELTVTHFDTMPRSIMRSYITGDSQEPLKQLYNQDYWQWEYMELAKDYSNVLNGTNNSAFTRFAQTILNKPINSRSDFDSAVLNYVYCPINEFGFRSMSFRDKSSRKRILLLGDSFTYGYNAVNKSNSFADILITKGYEVYNTGIGGSDPPQYLSVAKEFIPIYRPDFVIANICLGNDCDKDSQVYNAYQPHHYVTNAGWLESCPMGVNLSSPEEAYKIVLSTYYIPMTGWFNVLCSKTCISTMLWSAYNRFILKSNNIKPCCNLVERSSPFQLTEPYVNMIMKKVEKICTENGSTLIVSIIPNCTTTEGNQYKLFFVKDFDKLFTNQRYFEPHNLSVSDYGPNNSHFNEQGHAKYAHFLSTILDSINSP